MAQVLFFVALIPPVSIQDEVTAFKKQAAADFGAAHALRSPPHITLIPPFFFPEEKRKDLDRALRGFAAARAVFEVGLKNFSAFPPRVIFVAVQEDPALSACQRDLAQYLETTLALPVTDSRPYHPHMTVAFKDLDRKRFPEAWRYFSRQTYERQFQADRLVLLQLVQGFWKGVGEFYLKMG